MRGIITAVLSMLLGASSLGQLPLPEGAIARLGFPYYKGAVFSHDGEKIFVLTSIGVEALKAGNLALEDFRPFFQPSALATSPDGQLVAVGDGVGLHIYKLSDWTKRTTIEIGQATVNSIAFSPTATRLAVVYGDTVGVWNLETGRWERKFTTQQPLLWPHVIFVDERSLVFSDDRQGVFYWDFASDFPRQIATFSRNPHLALSRTWVAVKQQLGGPVEILDVKTGEKRFEIPSVGPISLTPNGTRIAVKRSDVFGVVRVLDIDTDGLHEVTNILVSGHILDLILSTQGETLLLFVDEDSEVHSAALIAFSLPDGTVVAQRTGYRSSIYPITGVAFSPSSQLIGLATSSGVEVWGDGRMLRFSSLVNNSGPIAFIDEDNLLIAGLRGVTQVVGVLNWRKNSFVELWRGNFLVTPVNIALSPKGDLFAIGYEAATLFVLGSPPRPVGLGKAGLVEVYSAGGEKVCSFEAHPGSSVKNLFFSPDGQLIATTDTSTVKVWESKTGKLLAESSAPWLSGVFTPDSQFLIYSTSTGEIAAWNFLKDQSRTIALVKERVDLLLVSPDGRYLYFIEQFGHAPSLIHIWDLQEDREVHAFAAAHGEWVSSAGISPDGGLLVTGSSDGTALVWNIASLLGINRLPVAEFSFHPDQVRVGDSVSFVDKSLDVDGKIVKWHWEFGDGCVSEDRSPVHVFSSPGSYTVKLTVTDDRGATATKEHVLVVRGNEPPEASFRFLPSDPKIFEEVWFINESRDPDGHVVSWEWDFGDGERSQQRAPRHRYVRAGLYKVVLRITDDLGAEAREEIQIKVLPVSYVLGLPEQVGSHLYLIWVAQPDREMMTVGTKVEVVRREVLSTREVKETFVGQGTVILSLGEQAVIEVDPSAAEIRVGDQVRIKSK